MSSESGKPLVYVVILTWNQREDTLECLASVEALQYPAFRVVLVDNGSTDGTAQAVAERFPRVEVVANPVNLGFGAGANVGMRHALEHGAQYAFLLNNDTVVDPPLLDILVATAEAEPRAGLVGAYVWSYHNHDELQLSGDRRHPLTLDPARQIPARLPADQCPHQVDYLSGGAVLVKRRVMEDVGLFDERFFLYYEDLDLCERVREHGYLLFSVPSARIWHKGRATMGDPSPRQRYHLARGSVLFFAKHTPARRLPLMIAYRAGSAARTLASAALKGQWAIASSYLRGLRDGLRLARRKDGHVSPAG